MDDVARVRPEDLGANTCGHILRRCPQLRLPVLEQLGLINALGEVVNIMRPAPRANTGCALLRHEGADSFMGHQEIMGTAPARPLCEPFSQILQPLAQALVARGHRVERLLPEGPGVLWVDGAVAVGDNLETDSGLVYNVTADLTRITFREVQAIGAVVRAVARVGRVIIFGGDGTSAAQIQAAAVQREGKYAGIDTPRSGVYRQGFQVVHAGYGVDPSCQVPACLARRQIPVSLVGKVADIVVNPGGENLGGIVDTGHIMDLTAGEIRRPGPRFICTNIQETDLAGHAQDVDWYADRLQVVDRHLGLLLGLLGRDDLLVVMADHGNDPTIGHARHTRERVPLLVWREGCHGVNLGTRQTLADVGATVCDAWQAPPPQSGTSFLPLLTIK
ncbi:putative mutase [Shimwellia blattae]|nr:putative mutase [Shimwellia blattae]